MGTNFYLFTKNSKIAYRYFRDEFELVDVPELGYEIHIGKRSAGWKPLFQRHDNAYTSVRELKQFIINHNDDLEIFNEYGEKFDLQGLERELINWADNQTVRHLKYVPDGIENVVFGFKEYFVDGTPEDFDIKTPFDHIEYNTLNPGGSEFTSLKYLSHDGDGYDFMVGDFL